jgi:hypothetical protein
MKLLNTMKFIVPLAMMAILGLLFTITMSIAGMTITYLVGRTVSNYFGW